jgi:hypothetical protein
VVLHVTRSKYTWNVSGCSIAFKARVGLKVTIVHVELTNKEFCIRFVANRNKGAGNSDIFSAAILFLEAYTSNPFFITKNFIEGGVEFELNFAFSNFSHETIIQNWLSAEFVATMNYGNFFGDACKVERFFNSSVTTANYTDILIAIKEAITSSATRNTAPHEFFLARKSNVLSGCTSTNNQRIAGICSRVANQANWLFFKSGCMNMIKNDFGIKAFGML